MTDLEMTRLCAEAMGGDTYILLDNGFYDPLHDDAQAMALVKKKKLSIIFNGEDCDTLWSVGPAAMDATEFDADHDDLNRAIVECVAKMQKAKP